MPCSDGTGDGEPCSKGQPRKHKRPVRKWQPGHMQPEQELHKALGQHKPSKEQHSYSCSNAWPSTGQTSQRGTSEHIRKPERRRQLVHTQPELVHKQLERKGPEPE